MILRRFLERLVASVGVIWGSVTLIFWILNWLPGDTAEMIAGENANPETVEQLRKQLGLDQPLSRQYFDYIWGLLHGDLGNSYVTHEPVASRLFQQFPRTVELTLGASAVALVLGVSLGVVSARYYGRPVDRVLQLLALGLNAVPSFWLGMVAIVIFSMYLGWLPVLGSGFMSSILPICCLGVGVSIPIQRMVRNGLLDGQNEPYVTTLRAKGLGERRIFYFHVFRNAMIPVVTLLSLVTGELLSGAVLQETIFARQGVGRIITEAISHRDLPMVQGGIFLASSCYVVVNLLVDLSYTVIDPRTRLSRKALLR